MGYKKVNFNKSKAENGKSSKAKKRMEPNKKPKYKKQWS